MTDEGEISAVVTRVARQIIKDEARVVGLLSVSGKRAPITLTPLIETLAGALTGFQPGDVAFIPAWSQWRALPGASDSGDEGQRMSVREVQPRVVEVMPAACTAALPASRALEHALKMLSDDFRHVLVDLNEYAPPARAPSTTALVEAIVFVVGARSARVAEVQALANQIPASKHLGAVLAG
jgi:hypothetical protein